MPQTAPKTTMLALLLALGLSSSCSDSESPNRPETDLIGLDNAEGGEDIDAADESGLDDLEVADQTVDPGEVEETRPDTVEVTEDAADTGFDGFPEPDCTATVEGFDATLRGREVAVVYNQLSAESTSIARYYQWGRGVPDANMIALETTTAFNISTEEFLSEVLGPVRSALEEHDPDGQIRFVATVYGVPYTVMADDLSVLEVVFTVTIPTASPDTANASVDSELAAVLGGLEAGGGGHIPNPYFQSTERLDRNERQVVPVTRLAVPTPTGDVVLDTRAMIERGICAEATQSRGRFVLDQAVNACWGLNPAWGNGLLSDAALALGELGFEVVLDESADVLSELTEVAGYASWGSNDQDAAQQILDFCVDGDPTGFSWVDGGLAATFVSTSARLIDTEEAPGIPVETFGQSMIWDLLIEGASGAAGHVLEPYVSAVPYPAHLFGRYVGGATLAESFYAAIPYLSWMTVVVGDPLLAPYNE